MLIDYAGKIAHDWFWLSKIGRSISRLHGSRKGSVNIGVCLGNGRDIGVWLYLPILSILPILSPILSIFVCLWSTWKYWCVSTYFLFCLFFQYILSPILLIFSILVFTLEILVCICFTYSVYFAYIANKINIGVHLGNRQDVLSILSPIL